MPKKSKMSVSQKKSKDRDRMREYRAKMKAENPEKYREKQRIQKQKYREKNKKNKKPEIDISNEKALTESIKREVKNLKSSKKTDYEVKKIILDNIEIKKLETEGTETLESLVSKMSTVNLRKKSGPRIDRESLMKYGKNIARLYTAMSNEVFAGDLTFLYNVGAVSDYIEKNYNSVGTKVNYYKSIVGFLKRLNNFEDVTKEYSIHMRRNKDAFDADKGKNKLSDREAKNFMTWDKILKYDLAGLDEEDILLVKLMTAIPPRRLSYKYLKLVKNKTKEQIDQLDKKYNYIVINKSGNATSIVLNNYKTKKVYRRFIIDLTQPDQKPIFNFSEIKKAVKNFMIATKIKSGDLVFPNNKGGIYNDFTRRLHEAFRNF